MKTSDLLSKSVLLIGTSLLFLSCTHPIQEGTQSLPKATHALRKNTYALPEGWIRKGSNPESYDMGIDKGAAQDGKDAATIKSIDTAIDGFGTLMQDCLPDKYLGKRVKMTGYMKTKDVKNWAAFWLRVDRKESLTPFTFDNMHVGKDRSVKGTTDWTKYEIVLDVPAQASNIAFGALIAGTGQIWFNNIKFDTVYFSLPITGIENAIATDTAHRPAPLQVQPEPTNLDFQK
jgi:hypothetical protein